jgi:hypothetical protein
MLYDIEDSEVWVNRRQGDCNSLPWYCIVNVAVTFETLPSPD